MHLQELKTFYIFYLRKKWNEVEKRSERVKGDALMLVQKSAVYLLGHHLYFIFLIKHWQLTNTELTVSFFHFCINIIEVCSTIK